MVLKEVEPEKLRTLAELKIAPTAEHAIDTANYTINQSKSDAQLKQLNLAASEYQKSENKLVAALGRAAEGLLKKNNLEDANLVLGMAELLTRSGELKPKYTEAWKHDFENYVFTFLKKIEKGLTDEDRKEALLTSAVVVNNIGNAARIEKLDYFSEKAQSPKWKESTRNFVTGAIEGIKALYEQEKFEEGDKALGYLDFFINTILKEGIKGNEGRTAVEQAVLLQLGGEREKAEEMFKKGLQQYGTTIVVRQLWEQYAKLESTYNMISDAYGKSEKAEGILAEAKNALDSRRVNVAVKKLNEFAEAINKHVKKNMLAKLDEIESDLKATSKVMEGYKEGLKQYVSEFPEQVKGIVKKIENVTSDSEILLNELKSVKKDYESGRVDEKKTEKFFLSLQKFSAEKKDVIGTVSTATLLFGNIKAYEQYVLALKMSAVDPARKGTAIESLNKATTNMKKSLEFVIKEGSESKGAKEQYEKGIYNVIGAIALLDLERLPYQEEEKKLTFFKQGFTTIYDKCAKAEDTKDVWELNGTLHNGLRAVLATDDKLFATKEAGLQQDIMLLTKYLNNHYIAKITGKKEGLLSSATVKEYKDAVARDSETLAKKIEHAELINSLLKTAATFIPGFFPAVFTAMAVETAVKEYEITNKISWSTGLMLAASALAFRGAIGLGMETATLGAKIANTTLNVTEGIIGTTLAVHGGYSTYQMFKEGRYEEGIANMVMFALPLFHTAAKKPLMTYMGKKVPAFRRLTGEFVSEDAINTQLKKSELPEMKELLKTGLEKAKEKVKAVEELPVRIEVEGTTVPIPIFSVSGTLRTWLPTREMVTEKAPVKKKPLPVTKVTKKEITAAKTVEMAPTEEVGKVPIIEEKVFGKEDSEKIELETALKKVYPGLMDALTKARFEREAGDLINIYLRMSKEEKSDLLRYCKLAKDEKNLAFLIEFEAAISTAGKSIEKTYGLKDGTLRDAYEKSLTKVIAKEKVADNLGIELKELPAARNEEYTKFQNLADDHHLWSILLDGKLLTEIQGIIKGGRITEIEFVNGLLGAYRISVVDPKGRITDFYVRRVSCVPDALGSKISKRIGIPAPDVIAFGSDGKEFSYTTSIGVKGNYGILTNIREFKGKITLAGKSIKVETVAAEPLSKLKASPELTKFFEEHQKEFLKELGEMQGKAFAAGFWDRHEGNAWFMKLRVLKPEDAKLLKKQGHFVEEENGTYYIYKFGHIDLDTVGTYPMEFIPTAELTAREASFETIKERFGNEDYKRVFKTLFILMKGREPSTSEEITSFMKEIYAPFAEGWKSGITELSKPEYKDVLTAAFKKHDGKPIGLAIELKDLADQITAGKSIELKMPFGGEDTYRASDITGRTPFIAKGERIVNSVKLEELHGRLYELVKGEKEGKENGGRIILKEKLWPNEIALLMKNGAEVVSFAGKDFLYIPHEKLTAMNVAAFEILERAGKSGDVFMLYKEGKKVKTKNEFFDALMPYEGEERYMVPWEKVPESHRTIPLSVGVIEPRKFKVYSFKEEIPPELRESAVAVKRYGDTIIAEIGGGAKLGVPVVETGGISCLEYLLQMGPNKLESVVLEPSFNLAEENMIKKIPVKK